MKNFKAIRKIQNATNKFGEFFNNKNHKFVHNFIKNEIDRIASQLRSIINDITLEESYKLAPSWIETLNDEE